MDYLLIGILVLLVNLAFLGITAMTFPGNWLMLAVACLLKWWRPEVYSWWTLVAVLVIASLGEWLEFISSAKQVRKAGGSKFGGFGAIVGSLLGMPIGQILIPIPIVGLLIGACLGAFVGAMFFERISGKNTRASMRSGKAALAGRALGTLYKFICGLAIYLILAIAVFWK